MSPRLSPGGELAYGSGPINPVGAANPGLIYNASESDYVKFLCGQGYSTELLRPVSVDNTTCSPNNSGSSSTVFDLNYPSFALSTAISKPIRETYRRRVTNVGSAYSTYRASIFNPSKKLKITVKPSVLRFEALGEERSFKLRVEGRIGGGSVVSASLVWDDGERKVRSPITVFDANIH